MARQIGTAAEPVIGTVRNPQGVPLAGITVSVVDRQTAATAVVYSDPEMTVPTTVLSTGIGVFAFYAPPGIYGLDLPAGCQPLEDVELLSESPTTAATEAWVAAYVTANGAVTPDATTLVKGKVKLAGDLAGTADLPTVPGLAGKAPTSHSHAESEVTALVADLAGKASTAHGHVEGDVTSLVADLAGKAATAHTHTEANVTSLVADLAGKQPIDADLTAFAALDSTTAGTNATDGAGWVKKTYAQFKTALALVKADVGLGSVDNTADTAKPVSTAQQTALDLKVPTSRTLTAGTGLTGGGDLSADRTLTVAYGTAAGTAVQGNDSRITRPVVAKTGNYTAVDGDIIIADATAGAFTVTIPVTANFHCTVKKKDSSVNGVTISPASGTVDGVASLVVVTQNTSFDLVGDGTNVWVI